MLEYWNGGMMGKDCSTCWRAGVLACTRTGEDARTPILKHPIIPIFHHSIIPLLVTSQFIAVRQLPDRAARLSITSLECWNTGILERWNDGERLFDMLACRRPRLHTYGRGRPYADIETPHYSNIPTFHYSLPKLLLSLFASGSCRTARGAYL